ncbi:MAG: TetR/AcrR family transcriptional regulator [Myxococcales bacterium]|nr:TetR/AcrR family transcriptional regulator [Myxococcales bacterium]
MTESEPASPKRRQVLAAAREVFMESGFERASCDVIAARAGVSKATIYSHFHDKYALFTASFSEEADALRAEFLACLGDPGPDVHADLCAVGEKLVNISLAAPFVALYRQTYAEGARFPQVGQMLYERGAVVVQATLGAYLMKLAARGELQIEDARVAAMHFIGLCQEDLTLRAHLGILAYPATDQVRAAVERGVTSFLRAYRPIKKRARPMTSLTKH